MKMNIDKTRLVTERLSRLPEITRSRGFRLYGNNGKRYVDLYRENGRMLLGHRPQSLNRVLKNILERGLVSGLPSIYEARLEKELRRMFPSYEAFAAFDSMALAMVQASLYLGENITEDSISDPLFNPVVSGLRISRWRPFSGAFLETDILVPVLPFGIAGGPVILCFKKSGKGTASPVTCHLSPLMIAGCIHATGLLAREKTPEWVSDPMFSDNGIFTQQGIYLVPKSEEPAYDKVFNQFLSSGFLLAPSASLPSILPLEMSEGELAKFKLTISLT